MSFIVKRLRIETMMIVLFWFFCSYSELRGIFDSFSVIDLHKVKHSPLIESVIFNALNFDKLSINILLNFNFFDFLMNLFFIVIFELVLTMNLLVDKLLPLCFYYFKLFTDDLIELSMR